MAKVSKTVRVKEYLAEHPSAKTAEVAEAIGVPKRMVYAVRFNMKKKGGGGTEKVVPGRARKFTRRKSAGASSSNSAPTSVGVLERLAGLAKAHDWIPLDDLAALIESHGWEEVKNAFPIVKEVQKGLQ